ncbi:MAG: ATP-dependent RNA helicase [Spirochaetaceae bacterium]|jgi:RNA helicase HrpA|nr:ATP-dependent RNA helicase [Spirochaetaceae bacterium]
MNYFDLPVYQHKQLILAALAENQVVVVESPAGSGKTTQLPVILHNAGFAKDGMIGVTQPRRIAALSVSEYIAKELGETIPGLIGYKMRFTDMTVPKTKIKIMTDGILLQEMKLDPWLSKYDCIIVDEAHERSLTIDFILGLLKRILEARRNFKVIVSSATINTSVFSAYFGDCPVVKIDAVNYPVTLVYDPPDAVSAQSGLAASEILLNKIAGIVERIISEKRQGDILVFLPGEKMIKDCIMLLASGPAGRKLHLIPLYGRLGKDEQERVFDKSPWGKTKVVVATNIAETSVTIDGITAVIDSGLSKTNFYNPKTFTSSLVEGPISKASCNQRKGRAGRTREGSCYRLYSRRDFESRPLFTTEEIYRTDLSEVVLRMAELGITSFEEFDFISAPGREGIRSAVETLNLLGALESDNTLSKIGKMMTEFPLSPRQSRIIVEAVLNYPDVTEETIIAAAFLSTQSPYVLPPGEEIDARRAHHHFRDNSGDFVSYLKLFREYTGAADKARFCEKSYLDERAMSEIANVAAQLELIVSDMGVPLLSGGPVEDYLCAVARGLIQFVCVRQGRDVYRSLTADRILIHPGSVMFKMDPRYIVAGEVIRTARMYASSVSPLSMEILERLGGGLLKRLGLGPANATGGAISDGGRSAEGRRAKEAARDFTNNIKIAGEIFEIESVKGKKRVILPWEQLSRIRDEAERLAAVPAGDALFKGLKGCVTLYGKYRLLEGEKLKLILRLSGSLEMDGALKREWPRKKEFSSERDLPALLEVLPLVLAPALWKAGKKDLGFICLTGKGTGIYRMTCSRGFHSALNESLSSVESLIDDLGEDVDINDKNIVNQTFRRLSRYLG